LKGLGKKRGTAARANASRFAGLGLTPILGILLLVSSTPATAADLAVAQGGASDATREVVEIVLDPLTLPAGDAARSRERADAIAEAIATNVPLFRSYEPRETLAESLDVLAGLGVNIDDAVLNFDTIETSIPVASRDAIEALPWVSAVRDPVGATPTGQFDSEGLAEIGSNLANAAGVTGTGIKVAIVDDSFNNLSATMDAVPDELPSISTTLQHRVNSAGNATTNPFNLNGTASQLLEGEHGTAAAEVIYEVAPGVNFILLGFQVQAAGNQYEGGVTATQIEFSIRRAADLGAKVILVPMYIFHTMGDPVGTAQGGKNTFTDDIDYATSLGATVVVPTGNTALKHVIERFTPCPDCTPAGQCETATNDSNYHVWDPDFDAIPLNDILPSFEVEDAENFETLTCYSATDAGTPSNFEVRLLRYSDASDCFPGCPSDCGVTAVTGATRDLNQGFTRKNLPLVEGLEFDEVTYYLAVRRKAGTATPKIRVACTTGVEELYWATEELQIDQDDTVHGGQNLSDLAVVVNAVTVGGLDAFGELLFESSVGPTSQGPNGPVKPDVVGPGEVSNFTVLDYGVSDSSDFVGTSAAAAHVAGLAALFQQQAFTATGAYLSPANVRAAIIRGAIPLAGFDDEKFQFGAGLAHIPNPKPGPFDFTALTPCRVLDTRFDAGPDGPPEKLIANKERLIQVTGAKCSVPLDAKAVSGIMTVILASNGAHVRLYPGDTLLPTASAINFAAGTVRANNIMIKLADNDEGTIRAFLPVGTADFLFDVTGYFR
jgi:subtilisin family serine protease